MSRRVLTLLLLCGLSITTLRSEEATPPKPIQGPIEPRDSLQYFEIHPAAKLELVASEPQVVDPVAIAFDEHERLWVVEMTDYPNGPKEGEAPRSRIKILRDKNQDGYYETATVFADKLLFANGVLPYKGGVIVTLSGEIAYLRDNDGDDQCDEQETWFRGFAQENPQLRANHPTFGLDGWVYVSNGLRGGNVVAVKKEWAEGAKPLDLARVDFRFHPETGQYEGITGTGQFGLSFDDFGNRFACSNRNPNMHIVLEQDDVAQNPQVRIASLREDVSPAAELSRVYSITSAWTTSTLHAGQFTAACGVTIYRGDGLPEEFYGNSFTCEPTGSLVHRDVLTPAGATFSSEYGRKEVEFLASRDSWFRPVNLANGPDGALYVCDMYRAVIEHPQFMPDELKTRPDLTLGNDRGRIWRVTGRDSVPDNVLHPTELADLPASLLVDFLTWPNVWQRELATRLIAERKDEKAIPVLVDFTSHRDPKVAASALWLLHRLQGKLAPELIESVLQNADHQVVEQLLRIEPESLRTEKRYFPLLEQLASTENGALKFRLALLAGTVTDAESSLKILSELARNADRDPWLQQAILIAAHEQPAEILSGLFDDLAENHSPARQELIQKLAEQIGLRNKTEEIAAALELLSETGPLSSTQSLNEQDHFLIRLALLRGLGNGLRLKGQLLTNHVAKSPEEVQAAVGKTFAAATQIAGDSSLPNASRIPALDLLRFTADAQVLEALQNLALNDPNLEIRLEAIEIWAVAKPAEASKKLLDGFAAKTPALRSTILSLLVQNPASVPPVLDAIEAKQIATAELTAIQRRILERHQHPEIKPRVAKLLANLGSPDRKAVLVKYQPALSLPADAQRGQLVFKKNCIACHKIGELGVNVAPDIADSRTAKPEVLLTNILDPNRAIDNNYFSYTIVLDTGKVLTGIIATETGNSVTLKQPENKTVTILKDEIEEMKSDGVSLMPVGLEKNISVQDMADLISFIKNWRYLNGKVPIDVGSAESR